MTTTMPWPLDGQESFLEPHMDQETLHLHYMFHHGGVVKAANKDLQMVKKALDENNVKTVDYWTKKTILSSLFPHSPYHFLDQPY